ncbi:MAG: hypothetical protein ACM31L_00655 [Actinomycetota bacterium]
MWTIPADAADLLSDAEIDALAGPKRRMALRRPKAATPVGRGRDFALYVLRGGTEEGVADGILCDDQGALIFSDIGENADEIAAFFEAVEGRERANGVTQIRVVAELPWELSPQELRTIVDRYLAEFRLRRLPFVAAVHKPHVDTGSDPRNLHLHVLYHDRPASRTAPNTWKFDERKDREARGISTSSSHTDRR